MQSGARASVSLSQRTKGTFCSRSFYNALIEILSGMYASAWQLYLIVLFGCVAASILNWASFFCGEVAPSITVHKFVYKYLNSDPDPCQAQAQHVQIYAWTSMEVIMMFRNAFILQFLLRSLMIISFLTIEYVDLLHVHVSILCRCLLQALPAVATLPRSNHHRRKHLPSCCVLILSDDDFCAS